MTRAVVVTGGAGGIGRAVCAAFAALGDRVALVHRPAAESAERAAQVLAGLPGDGHALVAADLATPAGARAGVADAAAPLGASHVRALAAQLGVLADRLAAARAANGTADDPEDADDLGA